MYRDSCLFDTLSQIPVKYPIMKISKGKKPPKLISLKLESKRVKKQRHHKKNELTQ